MSADIVLTASEYQEFRRLLEVEKIRKLRLLYTHFMDLQDIDALADLLAEDAVCEFGPYGTWHGRDEIRRNWEEWFGNAGPTGKGLPYGGLHINTNVWVEITGEDTAVGRSYLQSVYNEPNPRVNPIGLFGIYDEDYRKIDGEWKIQHCRFPILWPQRIVEDEFPRRMPMVK